MFRIEVCILILLICALPCFAQQKLFTVSESGKARAAVVLPSDATLAERTAARELSSYLKQVTGAEFQIYTPGSSPAGMPRILLGQSKETKRLLGNIDWKTLKYDGIIIKFVGKDLILAGDRPRGTLYAVYTFLEDYVGCKWWTPKATYIPSKPSLSVKKADLKYSPPFMYRELYYTSVDYQNGDFASKLKINGTVQLIPEEYGGHYKLLGFVHTFDVFLPAKVYFKDHPEWFSLRHGQRIGGEGYGGLCLTNNEMKAEFIKQALLAIDKEPGAGMISISQNDGEGICECDKCNAVAKEEGGQSGLHIRFVNDVADAIRKKYPDFLVETLAYKYTRHVPKLARPRDNVIIRLCSIECDVSKPLSSPSNAAFYKDLQDWKKICKRMYIWDYTVNYGNMTIEHPNWDVYAPNIRLFAANNVIGPFEQGDGWNNGAAFGNMKTWVLSKLLWNPKLETRKLMREYADGYYGPAGKYMYYFLDMCCKALNKTDTQLNCITGGNNIDYLSQKEMDRATVLFDKAEHLVVNNPTRLERIKIERLALDHAWILNTSLDRSRAGAARGMDMKSLCEDFISRSKATNNFYIGEGIPMGDEYNNGLRNYAALPYISPAIRASRYPAAVKGLKTDQWVEMQDSKITIYMPGVRGFLTSDPDASDGAAIRMPGGELDWASQLFLDRSGLKTGTNVDVYITVKAKLKAKSGLAFTAGIYDNIKGKYILDRSFKIEDISDSKYHDYYLGKCSIEPGCFVYTAPPGDSNLVDEVLVDRGFVIKSK